VTYKSETSQIDRANLLSAVKEQTYSANDSESDTKMILSGDGINILRAVLRDLDRVESINETLKEHAKEHVPSIDRVKEAHSWMDRESWVEPTSVGHRVYSQEANTQCYLCAVLVLLEKAEAIVRAAEQWRDYTDARGLPYLNKILLGEGPPK